MLDIRERNAALEVLAPAIIDEYDSPVWALIPAVEVIVGRLSIDHPLLSDQYEAYGTEHWVLRNLALGSVQPFDIDERLGNNDADYLAAVELQTRRVDDARFVLLHGERVKACVDCRRTTFNYHPMLETGLYCAEHAQARLERDRAGLRLVPERSL